MRLMMVGTGNGPRNFSLRTSRLTYAGSNNLTIHVPSLPTLHVFPLPVSTRMDISQSPTFLLTNPRAFRNLPQRTRVGVGVGILAWGAIGLYISDSAEKKLGLEPSQQDKEALQAVVPRISVVEREEGKS
jgi:hypothetical protein